MRRTDENCRKFSLSCYNVMRRAKETRFAHRIAILLAVSVLVWFPYRFVRRSKTIFTTRRIYNSDQMRTRQNKSAISHPMNVCLFSPIVFDRTRLLFASWCASAIYLFRRMWSVRIFEFMPTTSKSSWRIVRWEIERTLGIVCSLLFTKAEEISEWTSLGQPKALRLWILIATWTSFRVRSVTKRNRDGVEHSLC